MSGSASLAQQRTSLALRRTLLGLVLNAALLLRMPPLGVPAGLVVLAGAAGGYLFLRAGAKPGWWVLLTVGTGCLDAATILATQLAGHR
jgi:hypothetical protein